MCASFSLVSWAKVLIFRCYCCLLVTFSVTNLISPWDVFLSAVHDIHCPDCATFWCPTQAFLPAVLLLVLHTLYACVQRGGEFSGCWCGRDMRGLARAPSLYLFFLEKRKKWNTKCYLASPQLSYGSASHHLRVVSDDVIDDSTECWQPEAWTFNFRSVRSETYFEVVSFSVSC